MIVGQPDYLARPDLLDFSVLDEHDAVFDDALPDGVDATCEHAGKAYKTVRAELEAYGQGLADKHEIVALSKIDAMTPEQIKEQAARLKRASKKTPLLLSAHSRKGVPEALRALLKVIDSTGGTTAARRRAEAPAWQP